MAISSTREHGTIPLIGDSLKDDFQKHAFLVGSSYKMGPEPVQMAACLFHHPAEHAGLEGIVGVLRLGERPWAGITSEQA